jgi:hypothetical protein
MASRNEFAEVDPDKKREWKMERADGRPLAFVVSHTKFHPLSVGEAGGRLN